MATSNKGALTDGGSRIPASDAQLLISTYKAGGGWDADQTRAVWFSQADLADILALINENGGDGIRIYFGKYPTDVDIAGTPDPAYKGKTTLVFIPTLASANGPSQDLFPPLPASGQAPADGGNDGYNHGELCPPNCPTKPPPGA